MHADVSVTLLEPVVLPDKVQIITPDHDRALHLHLAHHAVQDTSTDRDVAGEGAFLVDVGSGDGLKWKREALN